MIKNGNTNLTQFFNGTPAMASAPRSEALVGNSILV